MFCDEGCCECVRAVSMLSVFCDEGCCECVRAVPMFSVFCDEGCCVCVHAVPMLSVFCDEGCCVCVHAVPMLSVFRIPFSNCISSFPTCDQMNVNLGICKWVRTWNIQTSFILEF